MKSLEALRSKPLIETVPALPCVVCFNERWKLLASGYDFEYETCGNEWKYHQCDKCGHVQIDPLPSSEFLSVIYPPDYYSYVMNKTVHPIARRAKKWLDQLKFRSILSKSVAQFDSYLDVGCGDGRYIELMIGRGVSPSKAYGVELDEHAVAISKSRGLQVERSRIEDAAHLHAEQFDFITMFHVIEHVARPDEVVQRLCELLKPGGLLAIETPNIDSLDARISVSRFWGGYHMPRHWHVFTPESLQSLLRQKGLSIVDVKFQPGHAFWIWTLHHWLKYEKNWPRLAAVCHPLRSVPLLAIATAFDLFRAKLGMRTSAMLILAHKI